MLIEWTSSEISATVTNADGDSVTVTTTNTASTASPAGVAPLGLGVTYMDGGTYFANIKYAGNVGQPTPQPTHTPSVSPTPRPTPNPTPYPTPLPGDPTAAPVFRPTGVPSPAPTIEWLTLPLDEMDWFLSCDASSTTITYDEVYDGKNTLKILDSSNDAFMAVQSSDYYLSSKIAGSVRFDFLVNDNDAVYLMPFGDGPMGMVYPELSYTRMVDGDVNTCSYSTTTWGGYESIDITSVSYTHLTLPTKRIV